MKNIDNDLQDPTLKKATGETTVQPEDLDNIEVSNLVDTPNTENAESTEHVVYENPEDLDAVDPDEIKLGEEYL